MDEQEYFTEVEASALLGKRVRAKRDWGRVPEGTQGVVVAARNTQVRVVGWIMTIAWEAPTGTVTGRFTASDYQQWVEEV